MNRRKGKLKILRILLMAISILYIIFLYIDIFNMQFFISSNTLKFLSMLLVFIICILTGKDALSPRDIILLSSGLFISINADVFLLLLNNNYVLGIALFSLVQILYSIRYDKENTKLIIFSFSSLFIVLALSYIIINQFIFKFNFLIVMSIYYGIALLSSTCRAIKLYKAKIYPRLNSKIIVLAMILFLLCDINVTLYNITGSIDISNDFTKLLNNISFVSMWLFYLPSQVLLSLSGYSPDYLKKLFKI